MLFGWKVFAPLLLLFLQDQSAVAFSNCPHGEICVSLQECPKLHGMVLEFARNRLPGLKRILRKKQCGLDTTSKEIKKRILVCCAWSGDILPGVWNCGYSYGSMSSRIVGGTEAQPNEFPWMALLQYENYRSGNSLWGLEEHDFLCSGSLINTRYVLTAAHCVMSKELGHRVVSSVRLGELDTDNSPSHLDIGVEEMIVHQRYKPAKKPRFDIALLRLQAHVSYSIRIFPICLPIDIVPENPFFKNFKMKIAGWGGTEKSERSSVMLEGNILGRKLSLCSARYGPMKGSQLCAGGDTQNDTCKGDSGSPLMATIDGRVYLAGITSYGTTPCGMLGWPSVYTRTGDFIEWIQYALEP